MPKREAVKIPPEFQFILAALEPLKDKPLELKSYLHNLIVADKDPLHLTKWLCLYSRSYKKAVLLPKLPSAILTTLCLYYKDLGFRDEDTLHGLRQCAFDVAIAALDMKLIKIVDEIFGLSVDVISVVKKVQQLLKDHSFKEAYRVIDAYNLEEYFEPDEALYPFLFLKLDNFVKKYLEKCPSKQIPFLTGLDHLATIPNGVVDFLRCRGILDNKPTLPGYLDKKWLLKKIASYLDMFNVDIDLCPNMYKHRVAGAMHYLCRKHFLEVTMSYEAFEEMMVDTVANHKDVQIALLWKLVNMTPAQYAIAVRFAELLKISREFWPQPIMFAPSSPENFTYKQEYHLPAFRETPPDFLKLRLSDSQIVVIDKSDKLLEAIKDITENYDVVGVDAEWKPNLGIFKEKVALLQLATWDVVYLIDVLALNRDGMFPMWDTLMKDIFCNKDLLKLGYGISNDLKVLMKSLDLDSMFEKYKQENVVDFCKFLEKLKSGFPDVYEEVETWHDEVLNVDSEDCKGLALLCRMVLGHPLSKFEQFSNWERRPLRLAQMKYAALDAYCLLMAYEMFYPLLKRRDLDWKKVLESEPAPKPKKTVRPDLTYQPEIGEDSVKMFKAVVDHHQTAGTIKMLRKLGADVIQVDEGQDPMTAIKIALAENRVLITLKKNYEKAIWYLPKGQVYVSQSFTPYIELCEILFRYNLSLKEQDFFSRCSICNKDDYIKVAREELVKHIDASETKETATKEKVNRKEVTVFRCDITDTYGTLHKNQIVKVAPFNDEVSLFFLCSGCGKLYWEGSHLKRYKKCLSDVIEKKTGNFLNYSNEYNERYRPGDPED